MDENGNTTETLDEEWDPSAGGGQGDWVPLQRRTVSFNDQGKFLVSTLEIWDDDSGEYIIWSRSTNTYDGSGTRVETTVSESSLFGPLAPSLRYTFTYHNDGTTASRLHERYDRDASQYENAGLREWTYDSNGEEVLDLERDWDENAADWVDDYRTVTEYTPNSSNPTSIVETEQSWGAGDWVNEERNVEMAEGDVLDLNRPGMGRSRQWRPGRLD